MIHLISNWLLCMTQKEKAPPRCISHCLYIVMENGHATFDSNNMMVVDPRRSDGGEDGSPSKSL